MRRLGVVMGTRPEVIKAGMVVRELVRRGLPHTVIHSGQHYDEMMKDTFLRELGIVVDRHVHVFDTGRWQDRFGLHLGNAVPILSKLDGVMVMGDTDTALAYAMAGRRLSKTVFHLEAGLRCHEDLPEEWNRRMITQLSDVHFAPSVIAQRMLRAEPWVHKENIHLTGNTVVDAAMMAMDYDRHPSWLGDEVVVTLHREATTGDRDTFADWAEAIYAAVDEAGLRVRWFAHPKTHKWLDELAFPYRQPIGYRDFISACTLARMVITDSGGIMEEQTVFKRPVICIRADTERPEGLGTVSWLCKTPGEVASWVDSINDDWDRIMSSWNPHRMPYGNGDASAKVADVLEEWISAGRTSEAPVDTRQEDAVGLEQSEPATADGGLLPRGGVRRVHGSSESS